MKTAIRTTTLTVVLLLMLTAGVFAETAAEPQPLSKDFRINVVTERSNYVSGGKLNLVVELLNNSPLRTHVVLPESNDLDPNMPVIIGKARLIPLSRTRSVEDSEPNETVLVEDIRVVKQVPLKLVGGPVITGHSSVVISLASFNLVRRQETEPQAAEDIVIETEQGEVIGIRPGLYLLDCEINRIAGVKEAHAEKIIMIRRPRDDHDNGRRPAWAQKKRK
ncbi:MAG: hypothetical protein ACYTBP_15010 [Planctomycetota bacterium]|jgi:hypothetical protein